MKMSDFLARLEDVRGPRETDGHFEARCPHCGKLGFLDITVLRMHGKSYIFPHCYGGCVPTQIYEAMGLTFEDLILDPEETEDAAEMVKIKSPCNVHQAWRGLWADQLRAGALEICDKASDIVGDLAGNIELRVSIVLRTRSSDAINWPEIEITRRIVSPEMNKVMKMEGGGDVSRTD